MNDLEEKKLEQFLRQFRFRAPESFAMPEGASEASRTSGGSSSANREWTIDNSIGPQAAVIVGASHQPVAHLQTFERSQHQKIKADLHRKVLDRLDLEKLGKTSVDYVSECRKV